MKLIIALALVSVAAAAKLDHLVGGDGHAHEHDHPHDNTHDHAHDHTLDHTHDHAHDQSHDRSRRPVVETVRNDRVAPVRGSYSTDFETEDGVIVSEHGQAGSAGQSNVQGAYSYVSPEGELIQVSYVADEFGFRVESPFVPTPPPVPAHVQLQIDFAKEQERLRAEGLIPEVQQL